MCVCVRYAQTTVVKLKIDCDVDCWLLVESVIQKPNNWTLSTEHETCICILCIIVGAESNWLTISHSDCVHVLIWRMKKLAEISIYVLLFVFLCICSDECINNVFLCLMAIIQMRRTLYNYYVIMLTCIYIWFCVHSKLVFVYSTINAATEHQTYTWNWLPTIMAGNHDHIQFMIEKLLEPENIRNLQWKMIECIRMWMLHGLMVWSCSIVFISMMLSAAAAAATITTLHGKQ